MSTSPDHTTESALQRSYDAVPYPGHSYFQSHPDRLATLATLLGLRPAPVEHCRVLELGCADGSNLIPMAHGLPGSEFVGIDFSAVQVAAGQASVAALGLRNITLKQINILDIQPDFGEFDYIIAHGIYSWVPPEVQDHILAICARNLAPAGVAYISYNTYPGWHMLGIIRDMMLFATRDMPGPRERARRALDMLDFLEESIPEKSAFGSFLTAYVTFLKQHLDKFGAEREAFLLHDMLEIVNDPVYFAQFIERAERHGLQYLVEADFSTVMPNDFSEDVAHTIRGMSGSLVEMEQYMDFLRSQSFRRTLLCRQECSIDRVLKPGRVHTLYATSRARPTTKRPDIHSPAVEQFQAPDGAKLTIDHPVSKAAMVYLAEIWPRVVSFQTLLETARARLDLDPAPKQALAEDHDAQVLAANLLKAYCYSTKLIDLRMHAPALAAGIGARPVAGALARFQARDRDEVTNLYHESVTLDALDQAVLLLLDGNHDRAAIVERLAQLVEQGMLVRRNEQMPAPGPEDLADDLERSLLWLANAALLVDGDAEPSTGYR